MTKSCATCRYWVATEMHAVSASNQPHQQDVRVQTEMLRATHALCSWPAQSPTGADHMKFSPPWLNRRVGGGELTSETDGADCPVHHP